MAGKLDPNKLVIGLKKEFKKEDNFINGNAVESAIKKIHADEKEKNKTGKRTKRITLDIEIPLHKMIAMHLLEMDITFKDYFLGLAKKDLGYTD